MLTRIIIPTKDGQGNLIENNLNHYLAIIAQKYGGYTLTQGSGGWVNDNGLLIQETVYIVDCDTEEPDKPFWHDLASTIKAETAQESVYLRQSPLPYPDFI